VTAVGRHHNTVMWLLSAVTTTQLCDCCRPSPQHTQYTVTVWP